jgi:lysozyme
MEKSNKITSINKEGLDLIKSFEGFSLTPYLCPAKVPTIGWGTTRYPNGNKVSLKDKSITIEEAEEYLLHDIKQFELAVDNYCRDDINSNQFSAITSWVYNLGQGSLKSSTLLKVLNNNPNDPQIKKEIMKWVMADKKVLQGLVNRRKAEAELYFKPVNNNK